MTLRLINVKPPQIALLLLAAGAGVHSLLPPPYRGSFASPYGGAGLIVLGFGVMIWAWEWFRRSDTPIRPTDQAVVLVTSGPFRFSRNPMYLGIECMLLGVAVGMGSFPMLIAPIGFLL